MSESFSEKSWRPLSYPIQSSDKHDPGKNSTSSSASKSEDKSREQSQRIPRAIRAVKDSRVSKDSLGRTLVICLDGTGDQFDQDNSNVVHLVSCLKKDDPSSQVTYYQSGIGTYDDSGLKGGFSAAVDMAVGSGLGTHVKDSYRFLMQNYREGDKICLFGFSRGSYTIRCLAGMLHKVGLLPAHNRAQISFAYKFYRDDSPEGWKMSADFKKTFCTNINIHFVGIWDCVASVGFIPRKLPFSKSPTNCIHYFRHAMALDEHRGKFKVCQWQHQNPARLQHKSHDHEHVETDVKEVWFMGAHADVGGGAVLNEERHMLSRIPLRWMIRQCFECNTGILFKSATLAELGIDVPTLWPVYQAPKIPISRPEPRLLEKYESGELPPLHRRATALGLDEKKTDEVAKDPERARWEADLLPEQVEDHFDSMAAVNDQLKQAKTWWILEFWPVKVRMQLKGQDQWEKVVRPNMGRRRAIREDEPHMHWTVRSRIEENRYQIKNPIDDNAAWKVVA
ncbi:hypothetical protein M501DRAFT_979658 [Patellaria atrata CBS 101060]|uniref:T6SS Phospholipase effector Tle1-like catalytic domain-containing protein n=1 Tax=Patellaria atrata CBS 101060 TaxID=1346257 RepID=A0A9P4S5P0_9PEZI|nr:hypothetical protein M501DRAFT_979658 [Patellaria atrata CBS 101060]